MFNKIKSILSLSSPKVEKEQKVDISLAVSALMVEIMHSDGKLEASEHDEMLKAIKNRFDLTDDGIESLVVKANEASSTATDFHQFTSLIKDNYSTEQRISFLTDLWQIAMADGHVDSYEEHLIRRIANLIGVYHGEFIQAKIQARENI